MGQLSKLGKVFCHAVTRGMRRNEALRKRSLERSLREQGHSRKDAKRLVAIRSK